MPLLPRPCVEPRPMPPCGGRPVRCPRLRRRREWGHPRRYRLPTGRVNRWLAVIKAMDDWWTRTSPQRRLDRNAGNMAMLIGLMLPTLSIVLQGPPPNSALDGMGTHLQISMCACIFLGCGIKLHGALSGSRWWFPKTKLAQSYRWGYIGAPLAT